MVEVSGDGYHVSYEQEAALVSCSGSFRLRGEEYAPIVELLNDVADSKPELLTMDMRELRFLNSSGINTLSRFILRVRKLDHSAMKILATDEFPWQRKSLKNLQRLLPGLQVEIED